MGRAARVERRWGRPGPPVTRRWTTPCFLAALLFFAGVLPPVPARAAVLQVVTTVFPLYDMARQVGGEKAHVAMLMPPGTEPHTWEPRPSDMKQIVAADVFIRVGREMEPWADTLLGAATGQDIMVLSIMDQLGLSGEGDPHFWLDLSLAARTADVIGAFMARSSPEDAGYFRSRAEDLAGRLQQMDAAYSEGLRACRQRLLVTGGHSAFGYLAARYGLTQLPLYGISPDSEPGPRQMAEAVKTVKREGIDAIFFEELVNPRLALVLAAETGARTLSLAPGANLSARQFADGITFTGLMERNLKQLREGLECE